MEVCGPVIWTDLALAISRHLIPARHLSSSKCPKRPQLPNKEPYQSIMKSARRSKQQPASKPAMASQREFPKNVVKPQLGDSASTKVSTPTRKHLRSAAEGLEGESLHSDTGHTATPVRSFRTWLPQSCLLAYYFFVISSRLLESINQPHLPAETSSCPRAL